MLLNLYKYGRWFWNKAKLENALDNDEESWEDKYKALEKAYKKVDKSIRKQFILAEGHKLAATKASFVEDEKDSISPKEVKKETIAKIKKSPVKLAIRNMVDWNKILKAA